jgi:hypothetical protein
MNYIYILYLDYVYKFMFIEIYKGLKLQTLSKNDIY